MSIDIRRFEQLKSSVEKAQKDVSRAEGALDQQMRQLKQEFKCDSVDEAETLLKKMEEKKSKLEESYKKSLSEFEEEWNGELNG